MSWRTVVITERAKLDMRMGHIVVRSDEKTLRINIDEVSVLIIENPAVSITGCLISALSEKKIKVIFCGLDHNPVTELFFRDVISREITLLCIENCEHNKCRYETRLIVDNDGCVI